ncbi:hypothetical protein [Vibrio cholerae]
MMAAAQKLMENRHSNKLSTRCQTRGQSSAKEDDVVDAEFEEVNDDKK